MVHQHPELVTNILNLSPTYLVSNIRRQHRCYQILTQKFRRKIDKNRKRQKFEIFASKQNKMMPQVGRSLMVNIIVGMIVEVKVENVPRVDKMVIVAPKIRVTVMETVLKKCHKQFWSHHGAMKPITCVSLRLLKKRALIGQLKWIGIVLEMVLLQIHTYPVSKFP